MALITTGRSAVAMSTKAVSSAQILALHTTAVEIVPAAGGRNYYVPIFAVVHYRFGTQAYATAGTIKLQMGFGTTVAAIENGGGEFGAVFYLDGQANGVIPATSLLLQTADAYSYNGYDANYGAGAVGYLATSVENKPFSIINAGNAATTGDGTLSIRFFYSLVNGAP